MIIKRTLPGYIWFDGHTKFRNQFKKRFYRDLDFRQFVVGNHRREKERLCKETRLKMQKKLDRVRRAYEQAETIKLREDSI